jgi:zinc transport system ATP-binding protein
VTIPLRIRGLTVELGGRPVLNQVDLDVREGEVIALLGANGSGKSTLVRAAVGLLNPRSGESWIFGTPSTQFRERQLLGYVPQRAAPTTGVPATVNEVVMSGRLARRRFIGPSSSADRRATRRAVDAMGLTNQRGRRFSELSGGQQQRALIARALAGEPRLLVMDEPTAAVDYSNTVALADVLRDFASDRGAVLLVEHELGALRPVVDRVIVLDEGKITFEGRPDALPLDAHGHIHLAAHPHSAEPEGVRPLPTEGML